MISALCFLSLLVLIPMSSSNHSMASSSPLWNAVLDIPFTPFWVPLFTTRMRHDLSPQSWWFESARSTNIGHILASSYRTHRSHPPRSDTLLLSSPLFCSYWVSKYVPCPPQTVSSSTLQQGNHSHSQSYSTKTTWFQRYQRVEGCYHTLSCSFLPTILDNSPHWSRFVSLFHVIPSK